MVSTLGSRGSPSAEGQRSFVRELRLSPTLHSTTFDFAEFLKSVKMCRKRALPNGHFPLTVKPRTPTSAQRHPAPRSLTTASNRPIRALSSAQRIGRITPQSCGNRGKLFLLHRQMERVLTTSFRTTDSRAPIKPILAAKSPYTPSKPRRQPKPLDLDNDWGSLSSWKAD